MRILVHDFGGYHFPLQLSRELAARGHEVMHAYCASLQTTPPGVNRIEEEPSGLCVKGIELGEPLHKYNFLKRWKQERTFGRLLVEETMRFRPDMVISANAPLDVQRPLLRACRRSDAKFVFWLQDLLGVAAQRILSKKLPGPGHLIGAYYTGLERRLLEQSDTIIAISEAFRDRLKRWRIDSSSVRVIPNWADLAAIPILPKANPWSEAHRLWDKFCYLYAGTLGMKHNPDLLLQLALEMRDRLEVRVVVVSQGLGANWLEAQKKKHRLDNLVILPFQAVEMVPSVLATGDVLVALLEPDAGTYSVPSKILAYLCAGRPLLLAMPSENDAAKLVQGEMGSVVDPSDVQALIEAAIDLYNDSEKRISLGHTARRYAEEAFAWEHIYERFEEALDLG